MMRAHEFHRRNLILLFVFLIHFALIFVISRSRTAHKTARQLPQEPSFIFYLDAIRAKADASATKEPAKARTVLKRQNMGEPPNLYKPTDSDPQSSNTITDWYAQAHSVAENVLENTQNNGAKRAFEHKMPSAQEGAPSSIFDPLPVGRAGTWDGPNRYYITDNCYYEWDRAPRAPPTLLDNRLKTPICKRPPKGGGDAMFKDLTPDYLKMLQEAKKH